MRFLFLLLDFIIFFVTAAFITTIRSSSGSWDLIYFLSNCKVLIPVFIVNVILLLIFSFYDLRRSYKRHSNRFVELSTAFIVSFVVSSAGIYFGLNLFHIPTPKTNLLLILLIFCCYIFLSRNLYKLLHFSQIKVVCLGTSRTLNRLREVWKKVPNFKVVYDFKKVEEIPQSLDVNDIDFFVVSNNVLEQDNNTAKIIFDNFVSKGIICLTDLALFEYIFSRLPKETLRNASWLIKDIANKQKNSVYPIIKRIFDILFALCLLPVFLPLGVIIYFLILFIDKQNPIFFQERVGIGGKAIQICKFRTMIIGTETPTKVGKVLRKFRLDEIPQLINILDGNISVVGPRPIWMKEYEFLKEYIPAHSLRNVVKPGLTGWSQLNFKAPPVYVVLDTPKFENDFQKNVYFRDAFVRLAYDVWYVKNASFMLDLEIMLKTAKRAFIRDKKLSE
ncbi:sugar transferase [Candidatus Ruminimicrobiellum ovillum]|uniref:sugar transferase n=1 Tax=Candidatus Ruminimicrobiellum ovillum TaxID=1947927 RepID=UPI003559CC3D